jgi:PAS domain S-box-containing protein
LHVDDDSSTREISKQILMDMGNFEIDSACCVDEAFKKLSTGQYDIIISDYEMSQKDGLQFLKELREQKTDIPFILFTGKGREEVAIKALNLGADGYFNKQGSPETVYGELCHFLNLAVERQRNGLEIKQKNEMLERVSESIDSGLAVISKDYRVVWANKYLMDLGVVPNKKCYQIFNKLDTVCPNCGAKKIFEQNVSLDVHEYETLNSKGEKVWIELRVTPLKDKDGNVTAALELALPISERKKAEEALQESQFLTQKILFCSPNLIYIYDLQENCNVYANKEVLAFLGYTPEQVKSMGSELFTNILHPDDAKIVAKHHALFKNAPDNATFEVEYRMKHASGEWRWLRSRDTLFARTADGLGKQILGMCEDITERKKVKETLRKGMEKYRELADSLPEIVFETDINGVLTYANQSAFEMTGYTKEDLAKGICAFDLVEQKDKKRAKDHISKTLANKSAVDNEYTFVRKDGSTFPTIIVSKSIVVENAPVGLRGVAMDITQRKEAEEEQKKGQAKIKTINGKLRVVGGLTRHDLINKLMTIKANTYLLKKRAGDKPELAKYLAGIDSALDGANQIIEFGRAYEKIGSEELTNIHVEEFFNEAIALFPELLVINVINESRGLTVLADSLLRQLFYNLIDNSLKHGEKITQIRLHYNKNSDGVKLYYEDNGVGIPTENKPKIFTESFTTGNGSGLGLRLIKKIMEVYGWTITEEGESSKGAKFVIAIPKSNKSENTITKFMPYPQVGNK